MEGPSARVSLPFYLGRLRVALGPGARLLLSLVLLFFAGGCAAERRLEAALVLADLAAGDGPSRLKRRTPAPERSAIRFAVAGRTYAADLYRSPDGTMAPLLLVPGAAEEGKDDPRLVAVATTLARAHFAVLVPDLPGLRRQQVGTENVQELADAFTWLVAQPELAPGGRGGMAAFSYAAGPAILAALEETIRPRIGFILAVGGYHDLPETLTFFTTGWFRHAGTWRYLEPNAYGKWVFVRSNLQRVADPGDREILRAMAERKMRDLAAPVDDLEARLGPEGRSVYAFLVNRDLGRAPVLLRELPPAIRAEIAALDLAPRDLSPLQAKLLLVHGYEDSIIPFAQSVSLDRALPEDQAELFLVHGLMHVDLEPGLADFWRLWRLVDALLRERDEMAVSGERPSTLAPSPRIAILNPPTSKEEVTMTLALSSPVIRNQTIPQHYTCDGDNVSPPLQWSDVPAGTESLALIADDPDAPGGTFTHWVLFNIPPHVRELPEDVRRDETLPNGARQGTNSFGRIGYGGPCPPGGTHRYYFKLYALDTELDLQPGASKDMLLNAIQGHILAETEIVGKYSRH